MLLAAAEVSTLPTYDIFYGGQRVARVENNDINRLGELLDMYQFQNSELDMFSEDADNQRRLAWGEGKIRANENATPRTTARFISAYDWNTEGGAFDEAANKAQDDWDDTFGNWLPNINDE